jgi:hypothetical protein
MDQKEISLTKTRKLAGNNNFSGRGDTRLTENTLIVAQKGHLDGTYYHQPESEPPNLEAEVWLHLERRYE